MATMTGSTLVYNVSENCAAGTRDVYTGGAGIDTVLLQQANFFSLSCLQSNFSRIYCF